MAKNAEAVASVKRQGRVSSREEELVKRCACGRAYTLRAWRGLSFLGVQKLDCDPSEKVLEMRACDCKNTLYLPSQLVPLLVGAPENRGTAQRIVPQQGRP